MEGTVSAGSGMVWENCTRSIPVANPNNTQLCCHSILTFVNAIFNAFKYHSYYPHYKNYLHNIYNIIHNFKQTVT